MNTDTLLHNRGKTHGDWEEQACTAAQIKSLLKIPARYPPAISEALSHIAVKLSRIASGDPFEPDHYADIAGYARLAEKFLNKPKLTTVDRGDWPEPSTAELKAHNAKLRCT